MARAARENLIGNIMRVLITGVCGFVGDILARGIREARPDWQVTGLDNLSRPGSELNRPRLRQCGVKVIHGDIRQPSDLEGLPRCDWILDAAANPSVLAGVDGKTSSRQLIEHNLGGTINLLELCKSWGSGLVMLSTSRVYSIAGLSRIPVAAKQNRFDPVADATMPGLSEHGIAEQFSTEPPLSLYGSSKRASEILLLDYAEAFQFPVFINRCGVLAGAGQFGKIDQGIFSYWIYAWHARRPLKYIGFGGTGHQVRDCLHPRDLIPLVVQQMERPSAGAPRILNFSGGASQSASLQELSAWCAQRFGDHPVLAEPATRPFDIPWLVLDSRQAGQAWQWRPATPLHQIWSEIAAHAEQHPRWLEVSAAD